MNFPDHLLPTELCWAANALSLMIILACVKSAPWRHLKDTSLLNVFMAGIVGLMLVWAVNAGIKPGLNFHLLGATLLSLMFGPQLAIIALTLVLLGITAFGMAGWLSYGLNLMLMVVIPAMFSWGVFRWVDRKLPNHLFVYIFVVGFFCAGVAITLCGLASSFVLSESAIYKREYLGEHYLPYYIFMAWSEAMLTGMAVTLMAAFRPTWLSTFNDKRYLKTK
jgi:uncharacterized membrane protein